MTSIASGTILVVHPGAELYGSDRVVLESAIALRSAGFRVVVGLPTKGPLTQRLRQAGAEVTIIETLVLRKEYLRLRRFPALLWQAFRGTIKAARLLRRLRPDALYVSTVTLPLWAPVSWVMRIPVLNHVHESEQSSPKPIRALLYASTFACSTLVLNSEFTRAAVAAVYPRLASRGTTIYNGVAEPASVTSPRTTLDGVLRVLFIGRLSPRKGADLILDAARLLTRRGFRITIDIVGSAFPGYEWYEEKLRAKALNVLLADHVRFHGFREDIWRFIAEADVVVVPSRLEESFGNTAVESMLAARPIIVSDTSGLREATAGFNSAILVRPDSPEPLADALTEVHNHWNDISAFALANSSLAHLKFSPARYHDEIVREVKRLVR